MKGLHNASPDRVRRGSLLVLLRLGLLGVGLLGLGLLAACGEDRSVAPPPPPPGEPAQVDELAPGEVAEGPLTAFGLPIPEGFRVESRSKTHVSAVGNAPFEAVANYIRKRLDAKDVVTGPGKTIFEEATVKVPRGGTTDRLDAGPDGVEKLRAAVSVRGVRTRLLVSRSIIRKGPKGLSEEQRWERLGVRKDGKPPDPNKFE